MFVPDCAKPNGVLVSLRVHTTVCEGPNNFGRVTLASVQASVATQNDTEMSNELVSNVSVILTNISDAIPDEQRLVTLFNALMKEFEPLVQIADKVAKVRSSVS